MTSEKNENEIRKDENTNEVNMNNKVRKVKRKKHEAKDEELERLLKEIDEKDQEIKKSKTESKTKKTSTSTATVSTQKKQPKTETKAETKTVKKETEKKTEDVKKEETKTTAILKKDPTEIINQEIKEKKNQKSFVVINVFLGLCFLVIFSTIFALMNSKSGKIVKGVTIDEVNVSNLTYDEAINKITEAAELELARESIIYYNEEYNITLKPSQIEAEYDVKKAVDEAYNFGRTGNIIANNFQILFAALTGENIEMDLSYNEESLNLIIGDVASKIPGKVIDYNYSIEEAELILTKGSAGVKVREDKLKEDILEEIKSRNVEDIINSDEKKQVKIEIDNVQPETIDIDKVYAEVHSEPQDAYYEENPFKLYPEKDGIDFAIGLDEAKKIISDTTKEEYKIPLVISKAEKTVDDIGTEAFPYLISKFSTKYDATNINRSKNLELAAEKINGTVLMPGEEFSYNQVVGKRTVEAGYRDAKIYSNGQVVDGLGGGICQISSTLYNAVLLADLEITERRNHYFRTSYVAAGRDATVVWGSLDFKFKNTRTYPVKIEAIVSSGVAEFKIHGIKEEKEYDIKILPVITQTIPYSTQEIIDPALPNGMRTVKQGGTSGCRVTTYVEKLLDGKIVSREAISSDYYKPMTKIISVGP